MFFLSWKNGKPTEILKNNKTCLLLIYLTGIPVGLNLSYFVCFRQTAKNRELFYFIVCLTIYNIKCSLLAVIASIVSWDQKQKYQLVQSSVAINLSWSIAWFFFQTNMLKIWSDLIYKIMNVYNHLWWIINSTLFLFSLPGHYSNYQISSLLYLMLFSPCCLIYCHRSWMCLNLILFIFYSVLSIIHMQNLKPILCSVLSSHSPRKTLNHTTGIWLRFLILLLVCPRDRTYSLIIKSRISIPCFDYRGQSTQVGV